MPNKRNPLVASKETVSQYLERFLKEQKAVLVPEGPFDIEPVHRMRVASRRLRAALSVFKDSFPSGKVLAWRRQIQKAGQALGRARELDIQIQFLEKARKRREGGRRAAGIETILASLKKERRKAQEKICRRLKDFELERSLPGLKKGLNKWGKVINPHKEEVILKYLDRLVGFSSYVSREQSVKELHRMRVAAKKLRYALEILKPWYGQKIQKYVQASLKVQDLLGDLHEQDVLGEVLSGFLKEFNQATRHAAQGLMQESALLRKEVYHKFVRVWKDLERKKIWSALREEV
jgi:CHAD domain-containing protein